MSELREKIKAEVSGVQKEIRNRTISYVVAAFGLVAGLAWNDAIKAFIEYFFPLSHNGLKAKFIYAILITMIVVLVTVYLMRITKKDEEELQEKIDKADKEQEAVKQSQ